MEEVIEHIISGNSPQELAIRFLLRHAECLRALTIGADNNALQSAASVQMLDTGTTRQEAAGAGKPAAAMVAGRTPPLPVAPEGSFLGRFSQAYAAARHLPPPKRASEPGSRRTTGSGTSRSSGSASAAA